MHSSKLRLQCCQARRCNAVYTSGSPTHLLLEEDLVEEPDLEQFANFMQVAVSCLQFAGHQEALVLVLNGGQVGVFTNRP